MTQPLVQNLPNGWTFSVAPNLSGTGHNVAAYPTPGSQMTDIWFRFKGGRMDVTVYSLEAALKLYQQVKRAKPPAYARQAMRVPKEGTPKRKDRSDPEGGIPGRG